MNSGSKLRRRDFLSLSVVTASSATLAACAGSNVLPQEAGAVLGDGTIVFNMYAQPAAQGRGYIYSTRWFSSTRARSFSGIGSSSTICAP